jgi:hypothetical protein
VRREPGGQTAAEADTERVLCPLLPWGDQIPGIECALGDLVGEAGDGLLDESDAHVEHLLKSAAHIGARMNCVNSPMSKQFRC